MAPLDAASAAAAAAAAAAPATQRGFWGVADAESPAPLSAGPETDHPTDTHHGPHAASAFPAAVSPPTVPGLTLRVAYQHGLYHEGPDSRQGRETDPNDVDTAGNPPHLVLAFNAGIWGYGEPWLATVAHATGRLGAPMLVTAYSYEEADDDAVRTKSPERAASNSIAFVLQVGHCGYE